MKLFLAVLVLCSSVFASGQVKKTTFTINKANDPYFQVSEIVVRELDLKNSMNTIPSDAVDLIEKTDLSQVALVIDGLIAIGKKIWPIIEAGKPVVDVNMGGTVSIIPFKKGDNYDATFYEMENWSMPKVRKYNVTYKNGFGSKVISFDYTVHYQYGGSLNGKGKYLAGISITASNVSVAWGFSFKANSELVQISNHGSKENQIAGGTFKVSYTASTVIKTISSADTFHVAGNGEIQKL